MFRTTWTLFVTLFSVTNKVNCVCEWRPRWLRWPSVRKLTIVNVVDSIEVNETHTPHLYAKASNGDNIVVWPIFSILQNMIGLAFDLSQRIRVCQSAAKKKKNSNNNKTAVGQREGLCRTPRTCSWDAIGHFRVHFSLYFKASLPAKSLL